MIPSLQGLLHTLLTAVLGNGSTSKSAYIAVANIKRRVI
jgi:hypothetical protein